MLTTKDVALKSGFSFSTVAAALRNDPRVAAATRERILEVASAMGYRKNAFAAGLAKARAGGPHEFRATIAFLNIHRIPGSMRKSYRIISFLEGAEKRAQLLGYNLEVFRIFEPNLSGRRLSDILTARGIEGVILYGEPKESDACMGWPLDWNRFSVAIAGEGISGLGFHFAFSDAFHATMVAVQRVLSAGYQRVALVESPRADIDSAPDRTESAFLYYTHSLHASERIAPLHLAFQPRTRNTKLYQKEGEKFKKWFFKHRPQVILTRATEDLLGWLGEINMKVPRDVGLVDLALLPNRKGFAGVEERAGEIGAAALDLVSNGLLSGSVGRPVHPTGVFIQGDWVPGDSFDERGPAGSALRKKKTRSASSALSRKSAK